MTVPLLDRIRHLRPAPAVWAGIHSSGPAKIVESGDEVVVIVVSPHRWEVFDCCGAEQSWLGSVTEFGGRYFVSHEGGTGAYVFPVFAQALAYLREYRAILDRFTTA